MFAQALKIEHATTTGGATSPTTVAVAATLAPGYAANAAAGA